MKKKLLRSLLPVIRFLGLFWLARRLTRKDLRILCYHGAAINDEHAFRGGLYIRPELFERRLAFLSKRRFPVLEFDDALRRLDAGNLPDCATVITIDDGWSGTALKMAPVIERYGFPATLYVSTYYLDKQTQVFHVAVDYALWRSGDTQLDLANVSPDLKGVFDLADDTTRTTASAAIVEYGEALDDADKRQELLYHVCAAVGQDATEMVDTRLISFMTRAEAGDLPRQGIDLQLHTHRHRFPSGSYTAAAQEIEDNRVALKGIAATKLEHFCYPSGEYEAHQLEWLPKLGVVSATTTKGGFVTCATNRYELGRFMDSEHVSDIEFEAEMSGFFELVRRCGYSI